jgi:hypothetical protein
MGFKIYKDVSTGELFFYSEDSSGPETGELFVGIGRITLYSESGDELPTWPQSKDA